MDEIEKMAEVFRKDTKKDNIEGYHFWKDYSEPDMVVSSQELWEHLKDQKVRGFRLNGFPQLDYIIEGCQEGELIVISGMRKEGKTTIAQSITNKLIEEGNYPLWFTYEVTSRAFVEYMKSHNEIPPLFYLPQELKSKSLEWIENRIKEGIAKYGIRMVFIDHLHYLLDLKFRNVSLEIGAIMRFLKQEIALKYGLVVFLICHTTKQKADEELDASDIRDSGFIGTECDTCLLIWRNKEEGRATMKVAFTRRSGAWEKKIKLQKKGRFFEELNEDEPKEDKWWNNKNINLPYQNGGDEE